jgi:hypothetical protein
LYFVCLAFRRLKKNNNKIKLQKSVDSILKSAISLSTM